ncbi:hypothetical protein F7725_023869 [Dissostichus mawsoni]|uniref:Maturase K n=1 Tax=Dissostichus mawsoni TaxID=36200 RepID=A0A7J5Y0N2_DISMA|nr:hypothetical protein F7725_023869 [Dissostichus mawsoni]
MFIPPTDTLILSLLYLFERCLCYLKEEFIFVQFTESVVYSPLSSHESHDQRVQLWFILRFSLCLSLHDDILY